MWIKKPYTLQLKMFLAQIVRMCSLIQGRSKEPHFFGLPEFFFLHAYKQKQNKKTQSDPLSHTDHISQWYFTMLESYVNDNRRALHLPWHVKSEQNLGNKLNVLTLKRQL